MQFREIRNWTFSIFIGLALMFGSANFADAQKRSDKNRNKREKVQKQENNSQKREVRNNNQRVRQSNNSRQQREARQAQQRQTQNRQIQNRQQNARRQQIERQRAEQNRNIKFKDSVPNKIAGIRFSGERNKTVERRSSGSVPKTSVARFSKSG